MHWWLSSGEQGKMNRTSEGTATLYSTVECGILIKKHLDRAHWWSKIHVPSRDKNKPKLMDRNVLRVLEMQHPRHQDWSEVREKDTVLERQIQSPMSHWLPELSIR